MRAIMRRLALLLLLNLAGGPVIANAAPADGPGHVFTDGLLDHMAGAWHLTGSAAGKPVDQRVTVRWVLGHQFLQIQEGNVDAEAAASGYEAMPMIGYDFRSDRYVAHWLDNYGGRFSETLGYGSRQGSQIEFVFEYPDGPFRTVFKWSAADGTWRWTMTQKNAAGAWAGFADLTLRRQ